MNALKTYEFRSLTDVRTIIMLETLFTLAKNLRIEDSLTVFDHILLTNARIRLKIRRFTPL